MSDDSSGPDVIVEEVHVNGDAANAEMMETETVTAKKRKTRRGKRNNKKGKEQETDAEQKENDTGETK